MCLCTVQQFNRHMQCGISNWSDYIMHQIYFIYVCWETTDYPDDFEIYHRVVGTKLLVI